MKAQTCRDLHSALAEEAEELVRYLLYSEQAYAEGYDEIGALFERAARLEALEHAREQAILLGEVSTTAENLRRVIVKETAHCEAVYPELARHAADAGDEAVAVLMRDFAEEKKQQAAGFRNAYARMRTTASVPVPSLHGDPVV